ncbi:MAG: DUF4395 domain-containing protein [Flavisolibacter sp.]
MEKQKNFFRFGEDIKGFSTPVLNEREIRASAGILFLLMFISLMLILFKNNFLLIKYVIIIFLTDLVIRVFVNPDFSPTMIIGRLIVGRQTPEYVGAPQKKFAWKIGIGLAGFMFILLDIINAYSIFTGLTCLVCLAFLFFESSFGICLGCLFYKWFHRNAPENCPGGVCDATKSPGFRKTSWIQLMVLLGLVVYVVMLVLFFNQQLSVTPKNLWTLLKGN